MCDKRFCFYCYEMNRDKSPRELVMPEIKPRYLKAWKEVKPTGVRNEYRRDKRIYLDTETGVEYFAEDAMKIVGIKGKGHFVSLINGNARSNSTKFTKNWTPFIKVR